jgi:hypothetical protein
VFRRVSAREIVSHALTQRKAAATRTRRTTPKKKDDDGRARVQAENGARMKIPETELQQPRHPRKLQKCSRAGGILT